MESGNDDSIDSMQKVASELSFEIDEDTAEACVASAHELESAAEAMMSQTQDVHRVGQTSADEYNAFLTVYDEPRETDSEGILTGISLGVKDNIAVQSLEMTCGLDTFSYTPSFDATVVRRLLEAGGTIVGKTNMDAFCFGPSGEFSDFGKVTNPLDSDRVPGGSSSGSGAAVAAGLVDAALGSDTGGSVRIPAACCGIVGIKPTHRLVPRDGFVDFAPSLDVIGPLARDVQTAAKVLAVIKGQTVTDPSSSRVPTEPLLGEDEDWPNLSFGLPKSFLEVAQPEIRNSMSKLVATIEETEGVNVTEVELPLGEVIDAYFLVAGAEFVWFLKSSGVIRGQGTGYRAELRQELASLFEEGLSSDHIAWRVLPAAYIDDETGGRAYTAARQEIQAFQRRLNDVFDDVDLLLTPTLRDFPPEYGHMDSTGELLNLLGNTVPYNLTGMPAVSLPIDHVDGLPVSVQVGAPHFEDHRAIRGARFIESRL